MKSVVTIIRPDDSVVVDGVGRAVDCSSLAAYVKAIQWTGESGWIEFVNDGKGAFLPNLKINDFSPYGYLVEMWTEAGKPPASEAPLIVAATVPAREKRKPAK